MTAEDIDLASNSSGMSIGKSLILELAGTIIAQNAVGREPNSKTDRTLIHEEQHAIKRLFKEIPVREDFFEEIISSAMLGDDEKIELSIVKFLRSYREISEIYVKDEILAYLKGLYENVVGAEKKEAALNVIYKILTKTEKKSSYHYFKKEREKLRETFLGKSNLGGVIYNALNLKDKKTLKEKIIKDSEEMDRRVFEDEYKKIIWEGLNAYKALRDNRYTQEQTLALLINEPLIKWPKIVLRLLGSFVVNDIKEIEQ